MNFRDFREPSESRNAFTVTLTLDVEDARALWSAAAEKALQAPGMTLADVLDTIGPREDPSLVDCIAMLTAPGAIAGCALDDFSVTGPGELPAGSLPLPAEARTLRPAVRA